MQGVSSLYINSCDNSIVESVYKIFVSRTHTGDVLETLLSDNIIQDTATIEKQSNSSSQFTIGGVCASKFTVTLNRSGVDKLKAAGCFKNKYCLHVVQWNKVDDANQDPEDFSKNLDDSENTTGKCELGYYYISDIENKDYSCKLEAYDGMIAYEKFVSKAKLQYLRDNSLTIEQWIAWCNTECSDYDSTTGEGYYNLQYAGSKSELLTYTYRLSSDSEVSTYRDVLGYLSQLCAGFMTFNENGELFYSDYTDTTTPDAEIGSDYVFSYDFKPDKTTIGKFKTAIGGVDYEREQEVPSLDYNQIDLTIQENILLRGIQYDKGVLTERVKETLDAIFEKINRLVFYGCNITLNQRPYIDLGDCIDIEHVVYQEDGSSPTVYNKKILVNSIYYKIGAELQINCYSSVADTTISSSSVSPSIVPDTSSNVNAFLHYLGTRKAFLISDKTQQIFKERFSIGANLPCTFAVTVIANITKLGLLHFDIIYDGELQITSPRYQLNHLGYRTFSFTLGLDATDKNETHTLQIKLRSEECELYLNEYDYQLIIMASGVQTAGASWTGLYEIEELFEPLSAKKVIKIAKLNENLQANIKKPINPDIVETLVPFGASQVIKIASINESLVINKYKYYPRYKLLATDATLTGTTALVEDTTAESGYVISALGSYPNNIASFSLIVDKTTNYRIVISTRNSGKVTLQLDGSIVAQDINVSGSTYVDSVLVKAIELQTVDTHTLILSSSGTSPYINYIRIDEIKETDFDQGHIITTESSAYPLEYNTTYIDNNKSFKLKEYEETFEGTAETIDSGYCYSIVVDKSNFSTIDEIGVEYEL